MSDEVACSNKVVGLLLGRQLANDLIFALHTHTTFHKLVKYNNMSIFICVVFKLNLTVIITEIVLIKVDTWVLCILNLLLDINASARKLCQLKINVKYYFVYIIIVIKDYYSFPL